MTLADDVNNIDIVQSAVDRITRHGRFAEFELSNGIVLEMKPVPPMLLSAVTGSFKLPDAPKVFIEEKGREEENPNDPHYLAEVQRIADEQDKAINNLVLGVGTSVKSVPEGYFGPDDDGWIDQVEFSASIAGTTLEIEKEDRIKRYLCWLRFYALETGADVALANGIPMQLTGIREGEVDEVIESFRGLPQRGADSTASSQTGSQNGNTANRADRRNRTRNRGT